MGLQLQADTKHVKEKHCGLQSWTALPLRIMQQDLHRRIIHWKNLHGKYVYGTSRSI